ncbi:hypothetical protein [Streptomyces sp. SID14515]|uniref:hypothetical protein n=1 Tax=Streptomyces sp. SID14515 TaxID=2706074 RepID=UPI0013CC16D8|nr:hypothetical protein [Streptomyces sp. SID14515]NEB37764.1 hypothetical protein [Streptomyces sp. SID14515]
MSDEGVTEPEERAADTQPLAVDGYSVLFPMVAMLSLEDDMTVVSSLNERLALMEGSPETELGERDGSGPTASVPLGEGL